MEESIINETEKARLAAMSVYENDLYAQGIKYIAGIDEAGRGPLAGPVIAAAVILPPGCYIEGLNDSKKLSEKKRLILEEQIKGQALAWAIGGANHLLIDKINILQATITAMTRAVNNLSIKPQHLLLDAVRLPGLAHIPQTAIIKGDSLSISIAAASILAKNHRDRIMYQFDLLYPQYGFAAHKGYPSKAHRETVLEYGSCPIHRQSFSVRPPKNSNPPPKQNQLKGMQGEELAATKLEQIGFLILERNYRTQEGEIDIIAIRNGCIYFVEVKARQNNKYGSAAEAVNEAKKRKIAKTAEIYLAEIGKERECGFMIAAVDLLNNKVEFIEDMLA
jgi:ribonuclease HII